VEKFTLKLKKTTTILLVLWLSILQPLRIEGFESISRGLFVDLPPLVHVEVYKSHDDHGLITTRALKDAGYSSTCIPQVVDANRLIDITELSLDLGVFGTIFDPPQGSLDPGLLEEIVVQILTAWLRPVTTSKETAYLAAHHFHRNNSQHGSTVPLAHNLAFRDGLSFVRSERQRIESATGRSTALVALGKALHGIQDFFANSNFTNLDQQAWKDLTFLLLDQPTGSQLNLIPPTLKITNFGDQDNHYRYDPTGDENGGFPGQSKSVQSLPLGLTQFAPGRSNYVPGGQQGYRTDRTLALYWAEQISRIFASKYLSAITALDASCAAPPEADFAWTPQFPVENQPIQFTDTSKFSPTTWLWTFEPNNIPPNFDSPNPVVTYPTAGTYTVTLVVSNAGGYDIEAKSIRILSPNEPTPPQPPPPPAPLPPAPVPPPGPAPPGCCASTLPGQGVGAIDPNEIVGTPGVGSARWVTEKQPLKYVVFFENKPDATAAAADVVVSTQLDATNMDPNTFTVGPITFGTRQVIPPSGLSQFSTDVDLRPGTNLIVRINAGVNKVTGLASWFFTSLDPGTGLPTTDPLAGFLPPNMTPPAGDGSVLFTIMPALGRPTGSAINQMARIIFDANPPIDTPVWLNTFDNTKPVSKVQPLPTSVNTRSFPVQWQGSDVGAGVGSFDVFVSDNGAPFAPWLTKTTATQAAFTGVFGHTYSFFSIARDLIGNIENSKAGAEASTTISDTTAPVIVPQISGTLDTNGFYKSSVGISWNVTDGESGIGSSSGCDSTTVTNDTSGITVTCSATNGAGMTTSVPVTVKIDKTPPYIAGMPAVGCSIWPPDRKLVQIATVTASDATSGLVPSSLVLNVTSNEPINSEDIVISNGVVKVTADRNGNGNGRIYSVKAQASDLAGNLTVATATCTVPHDQDKK
jgi:PKD repeat protein